MSIEAKVAQTATKVATEVAKQGGQNPLQTGESQFMNVLQQHEIKMEASSNDIMSMLGQDASLHPADNAVSADGLQIQISDVQKLESVESSNKLGNMFENLNRDGLNMERIQEMVMSGEKMSNRELMAMQAMIHQSALEIQIGVQAMDAGKSSIQTLVQRTTQ